MSVDDYRGSAWAFRELMKAAQRDIDEGGEIKKARKVDVTDDNQKTKRAGRPFQAW